MTITVSISQFRQNIATYIEKLKGGDIVILQDEKKNQSVAQLTRKKKFNPKAFGDALHTATGVFTLQNHPEWTTKVDVIKWLEKERKNADRTF